MPQYIVKSGQNIYDIAATIHGSVEGLFDLLISNDWLNMETTLKPGMVLMYHDEFVVNDSVVQWLNNKNILYRNGEHVHKFNNIEELVKEHITQYHANIIEDSLSPDQQRIFWENATAPGLIIQQMGKLSSLQVELKPNTHLLIDWGDYTDIELIEGGTTHTVEHCYKSSGVHTIVCYGDFEFASLDLSNINGIYYPLRNIISNTFTSALKNEANHKLIITK